MEIQVEVGDANDNPPQCVNAESVFEVQENEKVGKICNYTRIEKSNKYQQHLFFTRKIVIGNFYILS